MGKRVMRAVLEEIKSFFSWWGFFPEAARLRQEWYRKEIINAYESRDFERAAILDQENKRGTPAHR